MRASSLIQRYLTDSFRLFFPTICLGCESTQVHPQQFLCASCQLALPFTQFAHWKANPMAKEFAQWTTIENAIALYYFQKHATVQAVLHAIKYKNHQQAASLWGQLLGKQMQVLPALPHYLIPVPLHPKRLTTRGYNQALRIAEGISLATGIPIVADALIRTKSTRTQTHKSKEDRMRNMQAVFQVHQLPEKNSVHYCLVDDVFTTGATLAACAKAIQNQQSCQISVATLAYANS